MKVFVSWSKDQSRAVATEFAKWLPGVIQECADPFISTETTKGDAWFATITTELQTSQVGIVFITPENLDETWLNFESGAMLTKLGKQRLCPVVVGMSKGDYVGPLKNIQMTDFSDEQDMLKLLQDLNEDCERPIAKSVLIETFTDRWPKLVAAVADARKRGGLATEAESKRDTGSKVDEMLELVRGLARQTVIGRDDSQHKIPSALTGHSSKLGRNALSINDSRLMGKITGLVEVGGKGFAILRHESGIEVLAPLEDLSLEGHTVPASAEQ